MQCVIIECNYSDSEALKKKRKEINVEKKYERIKHSEFTLLIKIFTLAAL